MDRDPKWLTFLGLARNPGQRRSFSMRRALLSLLVWTLVTVGVRFALESWTNVRETWAIVVSVGIGFVASMLIVGGPFVHHD
jgi:hypothetical protein